MNYEDALKLATELHAGQKRRFSGLEYITHPTAVAESLPPEYRVAAVLHDVVEDTDMTIDKLQHVHGLSDHDALAIAYLTRSPETPYDEYIKDFIHNSFARTIKIADVEHNLSDLTDPVMRDKYQLALRLLKHM